MMNRVRISSPLLSWFLRLRTASPITFFGEDRGVFTQDGVPTGAGFPNAASAEASFLAALRAWGRSRLNRLPMVPADHLPFCFQARGAAS
jgi:hypothetical protein